MSQVDDFFRDLDRSWPLPAGAPITLRLLGSTALILQTSFQRGTKDSDILETDEITAEIESALLAVAGKDTDIHRRNRMYLEFLGAAFPFLPSDPLWHPVVQSGPDYQNFRLEVLDVVDVVIAKLARFHKTDRDDIATMAELELIEPQRFAPGAPPRAGGRGAADRAQADRALVSEGDGAEGRKKRCGNCTTEIWLRLEPQLTLPRCQPRRRI